MNRRSFLSGLSSLVGGLLLEKAIPLGRVWSFPKEVKCLNAGFHWDKIQGDDLSDDLLCGHRAYLIGDLKNIEVFTCNDVPCQFVSYRFTFTAARASNMSHLDAC